MIHLAGQLIYVLTLILSLLLSHSLFVSNTHTHKHIHIRTHTHPYCPVGSATSPQPPPATEPAKNAGGQDNNQVDLSKVKKQAVKQVSSSHISVCSFLVHTVYIYGNDAVKTTIE